MVAHDTLEERVKEFTLSDGLHVIVLERRTAPVISCCTYADVGACDEEDGRTGIAHLLEHLGEPWCMLCWLLCTFRCSSDPSSSTHRPPWPRSVQRDVDDRHERLPEGAGAAVCDG